MKRFAYRVKRKIQRTILHKKTEIYMLSYPKCGRTWLRMLVGQVLVNHYKIDFADPMNLWGLTKSISHVPRIQMSHDDKPHKHTIDAIEKDKAHYVNKKVILLVRDPRDVV